MNRITTALKDERGVALVMAMIMLVAMTGLMLAFLSVSAFEPQISQNLATASQARFVADAGLEWGYDRLASLPAGNVLDQKAQWDAFLAMPGGGTISGAAPMQIPGAGGPMSAAFGTFVVRVRNDTNDRDRMITGYCQTSAVVPCPPTLGGDTGGPTDDQNAIVILTSTATVRGVTKTVTAAVRRLVPFGFNGAMSFPGRDAEIRYDGNTFDVSGKDWKMPPPPPNPGSEPSVPDGVNPEVMGIVVSTEFPINEGVVESGLTAVQQDNVTGLAEGAGAGEGANTINTDPGALMENVHSFIENIGQLAPSANLIEYTVARPADLSQPALTLPQTMGSPTQPVVVHVKATDLDPLSEWTAVATQGGTVGYGVLIVEDGDLKVNGNFRWNGPVIVSGKYVSVYFNGAGEQSIYGAVVINETSTDPTLEAWLRGNIKIRYSKEALDFAMNGLFGQRARMYSWREN
ncbi:MAG TPA: hypothetical protein VLF19_01510 [Methylomirabilota bacterium]|nr:hypothetical protein [Methylomirabilota bacterium]